MRRFKLLTVLCALLVVAACERAPECSEEQGAHYGIDIGVWFDENNCMKPEYLAGFADDIRCLDPMETGCVTRAAFEEFQNFWTTHTPQPGISMCEQKLRIISPSS